MQDAAVIQGIVSRFRDFAPLMDDRVRRQWAASEALAYGWGGIQAVSHATGMSPTTIRRGTAELRARRASPRDMAPQRVRRPGGGRKRRVDGDPGLVNGLEALVDPTTRGDPESPLRWTSKSTRTLARKLTAQGHRVSCTTVGRLLREAGYSLQGNRKTKEGDSHPDRNAQFERINAMVKQFQRHGQPAISVDTKKKELVGDLKIGGREWMPRGQPDEVRVHDFTDKTLGKAIPYGVYDTTNNQSWVSVGMDHDTAQFAAEAVYRWWKKMGRKRYPGATKLLITADGAAATAAVAASGRWLCRIWPTV
jgi:hypothetical protein